mmetsp:Transcript_53188/g.149298  ORF Transcript_53188/g.149298 Transcript_53188/m.149298 type:complete len:465 (+) Transcript_53188:119-1513(+)
MAQPATLAKSSAGCPVTFLRELFSVRRGEGEKSELSPAKVVAALGAAALAAAAAPVLYRSAKDWWKQRKYEYGPVDITLMTAKAAQEACGKDATSERTSLIPDALLDLEESSEILQEAMKPSDECDQRAQALTRLGAPPFRKFIKERGNITDFERGPCKVLQLNVGLYCNQACNHCHVESSPLRKEMMSEEVVERCLHLLRSSPSVNALDITGGAPELNKGFKRLIEGAAEIRDIGVRPNLRIIDRCNLTVLLEPGQEGLAEFLAKHKVDIIASLPSYEAEATDKQRGRKVFQRSIDGLRILNQHGYGAGGPCAKHGRRLDLVFNPPGPFLPPQQACLDKKYRSELCTKMEVQFNQLITIANMPIKRFFDFLRKKGTLEGYMDLLVRNFNPCTVKKVMCIDHVNVGWDGRIFDCDFNQQLELGLGQDGKMDVFTIESLDDPRLRQSPIRTAAHCFGCTAAQGSS